MNSRVHLKNCADKENCCHSLKVMDFVTNIEKSLNREMVLNGPNFLAGLFRITPRIQSKISRADKRLKLPTSCQPIQHSKSRVNLFSRILSDSNCLPSQESLQLSSIEVLNVHSENDKKCITGPINDGKLPSAETIKSEFHQHACKSTPNPPGDENSGVTTSFQIIISETMNKEVNNELASADKKRRRELLIAYEKAMQPITSIDVAPEYEIQLLSLFQ
ncbi:unnamed protein product [Schistosoma rodhaini]|uniref:BESS domain-containing protein n=1 Tax=Schistosoma rodhaini TaxID=6188 RepID=A0A183RC42_9TREM|nr:unnamed protein product [Schistosoma rodhaini]CAH8532603.1 unnamed protein product [Schistosoma rodhaini]